jgi:hypothetical protein
MHGWNLNFCWKVKEFSYLKVKCATYLLNLSDLRGNCRLSPRSSKLVPRRYILTGVLDSPEWRMLWVVSLLSGCNLASWKRSRRILLLYVLTVRHVYVVIVDSPEWRMLWVISLLSGCYLTVWKRSRRILLLYVLTVRHVYVYTYRPSRFTRLENAVGGISVIWLYFSVLKEKQTYIVIVRADSETCICIYLQIL